MKLPRQVANPGLAALIHGSGFPSLERFAVAINVRGWDVHGVKLSYDHISVKRWLGGSVCQNPDVVAEVLSEAWGVSVPVAVIWPELRDGRQPVPAHLQPWVVARTLEELGIFLRSDMLTRRRMLAASTAVATGSALTDPVARWLNVEPIPLPIRTADRVGQINAAAVEALEQATRHFMAADAAVGGGVIREAAAGHLKYAVDLATDARYSEEVGNRLLVAIADLAGHVGWMCHDVGMEGPAQRYLVYGLQAARESRGDFARLKAVGILADMGRQMRALGHPTTALRLLELAFDQLPADGRRFNKVRSLLWSLRARWLSSLGLAHQAEVRNAIALATELFHELGEEDGGPAVTVCFPYTTAAELASSAADSYRNLARYDPAFATDAARRALYALQHRPAGFERSRVFDQITLARARFVGHEPEQASRDGQTAVRMAVQVAASRRVRARLHHLVSDSEPYKDLPAVRELRDVLARPV